MKMISVFRKSVREQIRQYWVLILTISMAPFFIVVYFLINEASRPHYDLLVLNQDRGIETEAERLNYAQLMLDWTAQTEYELPLTVTEIADRSAAIERLQDRTADALVVIPEDFSRRVHDLSSGTADGSISIEFVGDLTNINYLVSAVWADEMINELVYQATHSARPVEIIETSLGVSGEIDDFDLYVPGILILSVIMLMFSATIALVTEVENKTIVKLKLSRVSSLEFLSGVSLVQVLIGIISAVLTLAIAVALGFDSSGSLALVLLVVGLTSVSIIAFSIIIAALTSTVNEVLVVGNFPLFLFMFFTGAAYPIKGVALFSIAGYPITIQGLMSPTHSISAVNKVLILNMGLKDILSEIIALLTVTLLYFAIGAWAFRRRHMKIE
jgi:ABC-2 type transport system permease protein